MQLDGCEREKPQGVPTLDIDDLLSAGEAVQEL
jgi:hypothetical protein